MPAALSQCWAAKRTSLQLNRCSTTKMQPCRRMPKTPFSSCKTRAEPHLDNLPEISLDWRDVLSQSTAHNSRPDLRLAPPPWHGKVLWTGSNAPGAGSQRQRDRDRGSAPGGLERKKGPVCQHPRVHRSRALPDRKSTRLNSSHVETSYAVFCLKKKKPGKASLQFHSLLLQGVAASKDRFFQRLLPSKQSDLFCHHQLQIYYLQLHS